MSPENKIFLMLNRLEFQKEELDLLKENLSKLFNTDQSNILIMNEISSKDREINIKLKIKK